MGWLEFLLKSGIATAFIIGWPVYVYKWAIGLEPKSSLALGQKIYFEIEDRFLQTLLNRIFAVLEANTDSLKNYDKNPLVVKHSLTTELETILGVINLARGQREQLRIYAYRRIGGLVAMWITLIISLAFTILALNVDLRGNTPTLELVHPLLLVVAFIVLVINIIAIFIARHQSPLLEDTINALKAVRDDLRN